MKSTNMGDAEFEAMWPIEMPESWLTGHGLTAEMRYADYGDKRAQVIHKKSMSEPYDEVMQMRNLDAEATSPSVAADCSFEFEPQEAGVELSGNPGELPYAERLERMVCALQSGPCNRADMDEQVREAARQLRAIDTHLAEHGQGGAE